MKTTHQAMVIYTKGHNQHVVFTTPECESSELARKIATMNMDRLLKHAEILRAERNTLIILISNCNTTSPFEPRTPQLIINILKLQLSEVNRHDYVDMRLDDCHIQYRTITVPDNNKLKIASTFKYVEIIHDLVDTMEEAQQVCKETRERFKRRIAREELLIKCGATKSSASTDTLYWMKRQLNEGFEISRVKLRS